MTSRADHLTQRLADALVPLVIFALDHWGRVWTRGVR